MTVEQVAQLYRNQGKVPPQELQGEAEIKQHKYRAKGKVLDGIKFASTVEADAYVLLKHWERIGVIRKLELQPAFVLQEKCLRKEPVITTRRGKPRIERFWRTIKYIADFRFEIECGPDGWQSRVVDIKGYEPDVFKIKAKLFRARFPDVDLQVWDRQKVKELSRA